MTAGPRPDLDTLLAHADWVHRLSRQLCRDQHAAADAAQDTLLAAMQSPPRHADNLRGFFARTLRNVLHGRARGGERRQRREVAAATTGADFAEAAADVAARAELHQFLGRCVLDLPEPQRTLVLLHYFDGEEVATIAARSAMTADTVRGHLRRARDTLRQRLQRSDGDVRRGFALLLAASPPATHLLALSTLGLTMKWKTLTAVAIAVLALGVWSQWPATGPPASPRSETKVAAAAEIGRESPRGAEPATEARLPAPTPLAATTGALRVRVVWPDGSPGAGLRLTVESHLDAPFAPERRATTGDDGIATVPELPPGAGQVRLDWRWGAQFTITAGQTADAEVRVRAGIDVEGIVVDAAGQPVPTARVWLSRSDNGDEGEELGPVAADGTFRVRALPQGFFLAAIAAGFRQSTLTAVLGTPETTQQVRIELREPGLTLLGRVFRPDGTPAAGARVFVGKRAGPQPWQRESVWRYHRPPFAGRSDAQGNFRADGLPIDVPLDVWLRAEGCATSRQVVQFATAGEHAVSFPLARGATVSGTVTEASGARQADAHMVAYPVALGIAGGEGIFAAPPWALVSTPTAADGTFRLQHVPAGATRVEARQMNPRRIATTTSELRDGGELVWNAVLDAGASIRGTVQDDQGRPLVGWEVQSAAAGPDANRQALTDERGHFELADCGDAERRVLVMAPGAFAKFPSAVQLGIRGGNHDVRLVVPAQDVPSSTLTGKVRRRDGEALGQALIHLVAPGTLKHEVAAAAPDGTFRIGLLPSGTYRACATCDGDRNTPWTERIELRAGATLDLGTFEFGPAGSAMATVRDADGTLLDGVAVHVIDTIEGLDTPLTVGRTQAGIVVFPPVLAPGDYQLRVVDRNQPVVNAPFTVQANVQTAVAMTVPTSIPCVLRIAPPSRGGLQAISFVWSHHGTPVQQYTDWVYNQTERLLARRLVPGDYELNITDSAGQVAQNRFTIAANDPAGREIAIRQP